MERANELVAEREKFCDRYEKRIQGLEGEKANLEREQAKLRDGLKTAKEEKEGAVNTGLHFYRHECKAVSKLDTYACGDTILICEIEPSMIVAANDDELVARQAWVVGEFNWGEYKKKIYQWE